MINKLLFKNKHSSILIALLITPHRQLRHQPSTGACDFDHHHSPSDRDEYDDHN